MKHEEMLKIVNEMYSKISSIDEEVSKYLNDHHLKLMNAMADRFSYLCDEYSKVRNEIAECSNDIMEILEVSETTYDK